MRPTINRRQCKQLHIATTEMGEALQDATNLNWKNKSSKLAKNKTANMRHENKFSNVMTEEDLDRLFQRSKEKHNLKTETRDQSQKHKQFKDYTASVKFLRMDDETDKLLTGLPHSQDYGDENRINQLFHDDSDLTAKFKKEYMVGKIIGEGAYASVRVAVFRPEQRKIAIKAYQKNKIRDPQRKKSVRRQIKILQLLDHPNIVRIYDVVETNNHLNIIMEYLPGISLSSSLKSQPNQRFSEANCRTIMRQLTHSLKYLHDRHISHRDIKLENVIIGDDLTPKLIDFGFSTCIEKNRKIKMFCGTQSYMAPEIVQKRQYRGQTADIWALGVLFFVLLTGVFPFKGASDQELYRKINAAEYPKQDISYFRDAYNLIQRMFAINPEQRIIASQILGHPWMTETPENNKQTKDVKRKPTSVSKEREDTRSKKQKVLEPVNEKALLKTTKQLASHLNNTYGRSRLDKTLAVLREENINQGYGAVCHVQGNSGKKRKEFKILDLLKIQISKRKDEKSKCKSHRL